MSTMYLLAFIGACILVAMVPGVSTAIILRQTLRAGRGSGLAATLGNETGILLWALAAAFGLSALLLASQLAYDVMRIVGAIVLLQFVPQGQNVPLTLVALAVIWVLVDTVWYTAVIWSVARAKAVLGRPSVRRRLEQISGVVLIGLGVRLVLEAR